MDKKTPKILAIIPARGGSRGVPRKNIKLLAGKPLICYAIEAALKSGVVDRLVVSTEDQEIAQIAKEAGAEVIFRPVDLAGDNVLTEPVLRHVLDSLEDQNYQPDFLSLIQCTSPFLTPEIIVESVNKLLTEGADSSLTFFKPDGYEFKWKSDESGKLIPEHEVDNRPRRQDLDLPYHENGAFYITKTELFKNTNNRFGGKDAIVVGVEMTEMDSLQIDSEYNFWLAEQIMSKKKRGDCAL